MGWYVDGEWSVQNSRLSFLNFKKKSSLITNNLIIKAPRVEFIYNFKVEHKQDTDLNEGDISGKEILVLQISPEIYDISTFDDKQSIMHSHGIALFFFRDSNGAGIIQYKEFSINGMYNVREVYTEDFGTDNRLKCAYNYLNVNTRLNITMNFQTSTIHVVVNGLNCIEYRISQEIFSQNRATTGLFGFSTSTSLINLIVEEISIYKMVSILTTQDASFTSNANEMFASIRNFDKTHFQNASLSNILLINVC